MHVLKMGRRFELIGAVMALVVLGGCVRAPAVHNETVAVVTPAPAEPTATVAPVEPTATVQVYTILATVVRPAIVDKVAVVVGVGSPIPVHIEVHGRFPDTCAQFGDLTQQVDPARLRIEVQLTTWRTGGQNCIDDPLPFLMHIPLNAVALGEGEWVVSVNGVEEVLKWPLTAVDPDAPAAVNMRTWLSQVLGVPEDAVSVVRMEPVTFDNACLGAPRPDEMCAQVLTPGYVITLYVNGEAYTVHTDPEAYRFRLVDRPQPRIGTLIAAWSGGTDAEEGACGTAELGTEDVAFGDCGGVLMGGRYLSGARRDALIGLYDRYAPFEVETPSGRLRFDGRGEQIATPVEQRMLVEWAKQAFLEARVGRTSATLGSALGWDRSGDGVCEGVSVRLTGETVAGRCGETAVTQPLTADQLEQLYRWVDTFAPFTLEIAPQETEPAATERLVFDGRGSQTAAESDQREMLDFARGFAASISQAP